MAVREGTIPDAVIIYINDAKFVYTKAFLCKVGCAGSETQSETKLNYVTCKNK